MKALPPSLLTAIHLGICFTVWLQLNNTTKGYSELQSQVGNGQVVVRGILSFVTREKLALTNGFDLITIIIIIMR